jgi:hypothetical protein
MIKLIAIVGGVLLLSFVVVGGYRALSQPSSTSDTQSQPTVTPTMADSSSTSLSSFLTSQTDQQCTFTGTNGNSSGTLYVGNGKARGDFAITTNNVSIQSYMISDGTNMYVWMDGQGQGFTMSIAEMEQAGQTLAPELKNTLPIDTMGDHNCTSWTVDEQMFVVPTTVTFINPSALLEKLPSKEDLNAAVDQVKENGALNTAACAACNQLSGEQQTQCKQLAGCQ